MICEIYEKNCFDFNEGREFGIVVDANAEA